MMKKIMDYVTIMLNKATYIDVREVQGSLRFVQTIEPRRRAYSFEELSRQKLTHNMYYNMYIHKIHLKHKSYTNDENL